MAHASCRDYDAFLRAGLGDAYGTVGNYNLFMACEAPNESAFRDLPRGHTFRLCKRSELEIWKRVVVEEQYVSYVTEYFEKVYAKNEDQFYKRCTFVCDTHDKPVGSSFIWQSYGSVSTLGWTRVLPEHEGKGLGRALLSEVLKAACYPVYLHTQPTSVCAIKLYSDFGFRLIQNPLVIGYRVNDLSKSLAYLKTVMPEADFAGLRFVESDERLHNAALLNKHAEF